MRSENLTIMFTDIVGFTERTSKQSREENAAMLEEHDRLLLPIVANFAGRKVKSIGDALLVTFRSPTDAVRCGMALQDAVWEHNRSKKEEDRLRIRVALTLGEVRVEAGDVFGEPVNIAARIEGLTPPDEIYFGEAVYLAMNKAEVPCEQVGTRELKGIPEPVTIYRVPPHQSSRLVVADAGAANDERGHPFGGQHHGRASTAGTLQRTLVQASVVRGRIARQADERWRRMAPRLHAFGVSAKTAGGKLFSRPSSGRGRILLGAVALLGVFLAYTALSPSLLRQSEEDMAAGRWEHVAQVARGELAKKPTHPEALVLLGHVEFAKDNRAEGVAYYQRALGHKKSLRSDDRLVRNLVEALGWVGKPAQGLFIKYPSRPARRALAERASQPGYWGRKRALETLEALGAASAKHVEGAALMDLDDAPNCDKKRAAVSQLVETKSPAGLAKLRELAADQSFKNRCLRGVASEAVARIETDD